MMPNRQGRRTGSLWLVVIGWLMCACTPALPPVSPVETPAVAASAPATPPSPTPTVSPQPTPASTPPADCLTEGGRVESFQLPSAAIGKPLQGYLYLPPCFDPHSKQPYPLVILLHGQSADAGQWLRLGLTETANRLIANRTIPPLAIALPYEEYSLRNPYESGYDLALLEELLPWLAEQYPAVCREGACRALGGLSRGGGWALWIGFRQAQGFAAIGGHSAPPFYGMDARLPLWLKENAAVPLPAVYLDVGEKDRYYRTIAEWHDWLVRQSIPHEWRVNPGAHDEDYWRSQLETYLRWYGTQLQGAKEPSKTFVIE